MLVAEDAMKRTELTAAEKARDYTLRDTLGNDYANFVMLIAMTLPHRAERYEIAMLRAMDKISGTNNAPDIEAMLY